MLSCQCSSLYTSADIKAVFDRCVKFQQDKDVNQFVSVAVLDEVGLAEDSPKLPLKVMLIIHCRIVIQTLTTHTNTFEFFI